MWRFSLLCKRSEEFEPMPTSIRAESDIRHISIFKPCMRKNYNYTRRKLYLPEYGRHIHEMIDSLLLIEDRAERTRQAKAVIAVMGNLNPLLRDTADFKHKLWDHLFIMSDFQLDVDSPYPQPSRQELELKPKKLHYPQSHIVFKHYGKYAHQMVRKIASRPGGFSMDDALSVAHFMRSKSHEFNNEHPNNGSIVRDMCIMSDGEISLDAAMLQSMRHDYHRRPQQRNQKGRNNQRRNNNSNRGKFHGKQRHYHNNNRK